MRVLVLILGISIAYLALRAFRVNRSRPMLILAFGFGMVTLGMVAEGVLYEFWSLGLLEAHILESLIEIVGFLTILYSIHSTR